MGKIVLSIKPEYTQRILSGDKKYEYRKILAKKDVKKIIIYCTYPHMRVVGEVDVKGVLSMSPNDLWDRTKSESGIDHDAFMNYFKGRDNANAYILGNVTKYKEPKHLISLGISTAPQSFQYIE